MTKMRFWGMLAVCCLVALACEGKDLKGNGELATRDYAISDYREISIGGFKGGNNTSLISLFRYGNSVGGKQVCNYSIQKEATLSIEADENVFEGLEVKSEGGKLRIQVKKGYRLMFATLKITTGSTKLEGVQISGGMDFYLKTPLEGESLKVQASGGSDVYMEPRVKVDACSIGASSGSDVRVTALTCKYLEGEASGGSDLYLGGLADKAELDASGGSDVRAYELSVKQADGEASGGSDLYITATEQLDVSASGGSDIHYKGNAKVNKSTSGGSDVSKED